MPRRGADAIQLPLPPKKKTRTIEQIPAPSTPSLDISFCDDEALTPGIIFTDIQQKKWRIGKPIGRGSFGRIYLASDDVDKDVTKLSARYVIKIEPHTNGPLFVEVHCMIRTAQASSVTEWRKQHNQKRIGMPIYIASGSFTDETSGSKYRFLVLPRYDIDLHKLIARRTTIEPRNVLVLAIQILDVLEYLHSEGYTHSDIKSSNLMLGYDGTKIGKVPIVRLTPSFQKDFKEVLSPKHRKIKPVKVRSSNYYIDEDFIARDYKSATNSDEDGEIRLATVKKKLRRILTDKDSRTLHRHHALNLRQLTSYVNYEDMNSSVCSDQSYQKLIDDFGNKNLIQTTKQFQESKVKEKLQKEFEDNNLKEPIKRNETVSSCEQNDIYKEAVLSQSNGQIYLLDYGLASKFLDTEGRHKEYEMDARKAHDGTLEYSSRDSHVGAHSRRSDLETLGYNLLYWLTGSLPWKRPEVLAEPDVVHAIKKNYMNDLKLLLKTCFKTEFYPQFMEKYLEYVTSIDFKEKPDYDYCRGIFKSELSKYANKEVALNFIKAPMSPINRKLSYCKRFGRKNTPPNFLAINGIKKSMERENVCSLENDLKLELLKKALNISSEGVRKPCSSRNFFISDADLVARLKKSLIPHGVFGKKLSPKNLRSKQKLKKRKGVRRHRNSIGKFGNLMGSEKQFSWAEILAGNPEHIIRKERKTDSDDEDDDTCKYRIRTLSNATAKSEESGQSPILDEDFLQNLNPTDAMKDVIAVLKNKSSTDDMQIPKGYTAAMVKVLKIKEMREAAEKLEVTKTIRRRSKKTVALTSRVTRQKLSMDATDDDRVNEKLKPTRVTRQKSSGSLKEVTPNKKRVTRQKASVDSSKEVTLISSPLPTKRVTRQKASFGVKEEKPSNGTKSKGRKAKNDEEIIDKTPPTKTIKKSPKKADPVPIFRTRLRSGRRIVKASD